MKQAILFFLFFACAASVVQSQVTIAFTPQTIEKEGVADPNDLFMEIVGKAYVVNEGDEPVSIQWVRNPDIPEDWQTMICDNNQCYPAHVYSNIMEELGLNAPITLNPGDTTNIDVHLQPKGVAGEGTVTMEVYDLANPDEVAVSADFNFTASLPSSTSNLDQTPLSVFPNPTADYFNIRGGNGIDRIVLFNVLGREMRSFNVAPGQRYYIGDLPNGLYLASMVDNSKGIVKTLRLKKSSIRP
ncbi:MAG: T9SS type A sorting domain-containing protein [Phaeodactylibacter sp.]|nr:T9SS type A sorting domain-containing protein [Phaeodactylibacter sp.]